MKKILISAALVMIIIAAFTACKKAPDDSESTTDSQQSAAVEAISGEKLSRAFSDEERMAEIASLMETEDASVLDMTIDFWYPKDLDEALAYAEDFEYDRKDVETENSTELDSYWLDSKTDYPVAQRTVDDKGRIAQVVRNNLDGTYYRITYLYEAEDGAKADEGMLLEVIKDNAGPDGGSAGIIKSYSFQFYPNDKIYSATEQYYDENGEQGEFYAYVFDPEGRIVHYLDTDVYTQMMQERLLANLGSIFDEVASSLDMQDILSQAGLDGLAGMP